MYLKKIEAQGFKSFANKMVLEFHQGIMGIVGPNGSGKSNVADAVRWVLGEQSAKSLRGSNMQDVIFAGTENRKPQGYAFVALTIDNSDHMLAIDYDEVTISRRVYRSGESEYLINGNSCRLKDINELFYDTGVGKEGYSIIGQGQIDKILSGKPEDRRELFDEAAGIVKFKKRKYVAMKKLENEQANLTRVSDILHELEKQVGPLEKQSEKAREYLRLKEELKAYEIGAYFLESEDLHRRLGEVEQNLAIVTADLEQNRENAEALRTRYEEASENSRSLEHSMEEHRSALSDTRLRIGETEGNIRLLQEQIKTAQMNREHLEERMAFIDADLQVKTEERAGFLEQKAALNLELDRADDLIDQVSEKMNGIEESIDQLERQTEHEQNQIIEDLSRKAEINADRQKYTTQLEQAQLTRSEIHRYLLEEKTGQEKQERVLGTLRKEQEELLKRATELDQQSKQAEAAVVKTEMNLAEIRNHLTAATQEYQNLKSRYDYLSNMTERYEGYGNSIRKVMEQKKNEAGIVGVVADLFQTEKKYETALETALGGRIQNIVTRDEATAKKMIGYLKQNRLGRATFLPIESVQGRENFPRPEALKETGALGIASDLITCEKPYEGVASFLLGRTLVVDTIDHALTIARKYHHTLNIVTLEGESLTPGGAMTGGAFKNNSNLLGRRRELEELEENIKKSLSRCNSTKSRLSSVEHELVDARNRSEELKEKLHDAQLAETTARLNLQRETEALERIQENMRRRQQENDQIQSRISEIRQQEKEIQDLVKDLDNRNKQSQKDIARLNHQLEKQREKRNTLNEDLSAKRVAFERLSQKDSFLMENISRLNGELNKLTEEKRQLTESKLKGVDSVEIKQAEIEASREQIQILKQEEEQLLLCLTQETKKKEEAVGEQKNLFDRREEIMAAVNQLDKDSYRLTSQKERLEENLEKQTEYIWTEYEMTPTEAEACRNPDFTNLTEVRRETAKRKTAIRELGPVNVNAIEEYKEVHERYIFMSSQHSDLVEARDSLVKIIDELDAGMRKQFQEKFEAIRVEFDRVFRELFGGGKGTLELICDDGKDILEAGISIIAQPPGKKLQNMLQLSGGEKALSAIALLFAIQNLKPSPFCLLDEIEAALDEPNVARYADYLNRLKEHTQFIVITHRRGTMEMADRLYGITMQEKGVSTLVSVDLTDQSLVG